MSWTPDPADTAGADTSRTDRNAERAAWSPRAALQRDRDEVTSVAWEASRAGTAIELRRQRGVDVTEPPRGQSFGAGRLSEAMKIADRHGGFLDVATTTRGGDGRYG